MLRKQRINLNFTFERKIIIDYQYFIKFKIQKLVTNFHFCNCFLQKLFNSWSEKLEILKNKSNLKKYKQN